MPRPPDYHVQHSCRDCLRCTDLSPQQEPLRLRCMFGFTPPHKATGGKPVSVAGICSHWAAYYHEEKEPDDALDNLDSEEAQQAGEQQVGTDRQ